MLMPARIMTASCVVKSRISFFPGPLDQLSFSLSPENRSCVAVGASWTTWSPLPRSIAAAVAASAAARPPASTLPDPLRA